MPSPPAGCRDPRLWLEAQELVEQHASRGGLCVACGTPAPCRIADAATDAQRRAMPPEEPAVAPEAEFEPTPVRRAPSVGARFPRATGDWPEAADDIAEPGYPPPLEDEPATPVGARFRRESRAGRRRRSG